MSESLDTLDTLISAVLESKKGAKNNLISALAVVPIAEWVAATLHQSAHVRGAAVAAAWGRAEPEIFERLTALVPDRAKQVTKGFQAALRRANEWTLPPEFVAAALARFTGDECLPLIEKAKGHGVCLPGILKIVEKNSYPTARPASEALETFEALDVIAPLVDMCAALRHYDVDLFRPLEFHLSSDPAKELLLSAEPEKLKKLALHTADQLSNHPRLHPLLDPYRTIDVDTNALRSYGRLLSAEAAANRLPRGYQLDAACERLLGLVTRDPGEGPRSAILVGKPGVGKTALAHEMAYRLNDRGWQLIEVSPSDLMVGTKYLGEWETRLQKLIENIRSPKKIVVYMPNLAGLLTTGQSSKSDTSASDMLTPWLSRGDVAIIGESSEEGFKRIMATSPNFRRLFTEFNVVGATVEATSKLAQRIADDAQLTLDPQALESLLELSDSFYGHIERPGRALTLLRRAVDRGGSVIDQRMLLEVLNESTGVPVEFLDTRSALDLNELRRELALRVMGQPDAVAAATDTITMCKAGLTDPERPNGVMLFVGPTGVGKTELAKAMAKVLFGDEQRLIRFDMSEFASFESYERLIGGRSNTGLLTDAVRAQPFSIVLLDEIEKAHVNVFDLCLQMFDAGRLTDGQGNLVDLRNAIIIMTSNVGSKIATAPPPGFGGTAGGAEATTITRELERAFRPEFLNRIDRIVMFRALDADTTEKIIRREITAVLTRSGIARRRITVDIDSTVVGLMMRHGYSPAFGARPIKRAIDQRLLLPLGQAIAMGMVGSDAFVRLTVANDEIVVERVKTRTTKVSSASDLESDASPPSLDDLRALLVELQNLAEPYAARKSELLARQTEASFWEHRALMVSTLDEIQRIDRVLSDLGRLERDIERTERNPDLGRRAPYVAAHHREVRRLRGLMVGNDLRDCVVVIERVGPRDAGLRILEQLVSMYESFAQSVHLEVTLVDDVVADPKLGDVDRVALLVTGAGSFVQFEPEVGLHRFRQTSDTRSETDVARVTVIALDAVVPDAAMRSMSVATTPLSSIGRFATDLRTRTVARSGSTTVELANGIDSETSQETAALWLLTMTTAPPRPSDDLVRRYEFGPSPVVRDAQSGRSSGRLDRVLAGSLDLVRGPGTPS